MAERRYTAFIPDYVQSILFNSHNLPETYHHSNFRLTYAQVFDEFFSKHVTIEVSSSDTAKGKRYYFRVQHREEAPNFGIDYEDWETAACAAIKSAVNKVAEIRERGGRRGRLGGIPLFVRSKADKYFMKITPPYDGDDIASAYETGYLDGLNYINEETTNEPD